MANRAVYEINPDAGGRWVQFFGRAPRGSWAASWGSRPILIPGMSHFAPAIKGAGGPRFLCVECREPLGVCSCFKPRYDHHG